MKRHLLFWLVLIAALCGSCERRPSPNDPVFCPRPSGTPHYLTAPPELLPTPVPVSVPTQMEIEGKSVLVDRVVEGPLCSGTWRGTVYVTCNVQVYPWAEQPTFLKDCDLTIEPGTVVYVADHGDQPYYQGCLCHTGAGVP